MSDNTLGVSALDAYVDSIDDGAPLSDSEKHLQQALKAARLEEVHAWLKDRFKTAYEQGDYINEAAAVETLYLIETGKQPENDNREDVETFRRHLLDELL
jgi:hypothetical protein